MHGAEFKAPVRAECQEPGASVAAIALAHGLNVNLLRKWRTLDLVAEILSQLFSAAPTTA